MLAQEISRLNEHPSLPKNAGLEEKLAAHSPRWRGLYTEAAGETFCFAKKLAYSKKLYALIGTEAPDGEDSRTRAEQLVAYCNEPLLKVVYRRFALNPCCDGSNLDSFVAGLERDLKIEFRHFIQNEKLEQKRMGMGFSRQDQRILRDYNRFKESLLQYNGGSLPEDAIQGQYLAGHNGFKVTPEKLKSVLAGHCQTAVQQDCDLRRDEAAGNEPSFLDGIADGSLCLDRDDRAGCPELVEAILHCLEKIYQKKQRRAQKYFSALMTQWFLERIKECTSVDGPFITRLHDFSFVDGELLSQFERDGSVPDRQTVLRRFPVLKNGVVQLDKDGQPRCKDKGRASNDIRGVLDELKEMLGGRGFSP